MNWLNDIKTAATTFAERIGDARAAEPEKTNVFEVADDFWNYRPVLIALACLLLVFFLWSALSEIDQHVTASGRIIPAGNARIVQHLEGGIVETIMVKEGQKVSVGETLFLVANTRAKTQLKEAAIEEQALQAKKLRIEAEQNDLEVLELPASLVAANPDLARREMSLFEANRQSYLETVKGIEERQNQKAFELDALQAQIGNIKQELDVSNRQLAIRKKLLDAGAISETLFLNNKSQSRKLITQLESAKNRVPILKAEKTELESLLEESRQNHHVDIAEKFNTAKLQAETLAERIAALQDRVTRSSITSPIDGTVNKLHIHTVGGVSQPGAPLAEIIPANETLVVEGQIATTDRGKVWPDLPALTKISAYDYTIYGGIDGELIYISPDSFVDKQNREHYKVRIALESDRLGDDQQVRPGMTAEVSILTGQISILGALLKPLTNIRHQALRES
ncbi:MAG: HlyD family type I secretion periplasmic adaptor subunit [Pseudomonadales bacterium]